MWLKLLKLLDRWPKIKEKLLLKMLMRPAGANGEDAKELSTSSYGSLSDFGDAIVTFHQYFDVGLRKLGDYAKLYALCSCTSC